MSQTSQKALIEKSLQCVALARTLRDRYPDPTTMPAEDRQKMSLLQKKARELKTQADLEKEQDELEAWGREPDRLAQAVHAEDLVAATATGRIGPDAERFEKTMRARQVELFAKALRMDKAERVQWLAGLDTVEKAALVEDSTGEIIVPADIAGPIFKTLPHLAVFRSSGPTIRNTRSDRVSLRSLTGATAGWGKIEVTGATATDAGISATGPDQVDVHDLMAMSKIGTDELADTDTNLVQLITDIVSQKVAEMEDDAFAAGNGVSKPWGLAARATAASNTITQAVTAAANAVPTGDNLKSLQYRVPSRFRGNGAYFSSSDAAEAISLLKDSTSNYLWQPSIRAGEPDTLFGKRFYILEGMPSMGASAAAVDPSVIYGDPALGYMIADRQTITVQRLDERFAEVGLVAFLFKMRVGGDVMRPAAFAKYLL